MEFAGVFQRHPVEGFGAKSSDCGDGHRYGETDDQGECSAEGEVARRRTIATASAASGPNSGPTTMAPTTVTGESVTTPTAAIKHARQRNAMKVTLSRDSSRVRAASSS